MGGGGGGGGCKEEWGWELQGLTHVDEKGRPQMVEVGSKQVSQRVATASALLWAPDEVMSLLDQSTGEMQGRKGPVIATAIIAGTMAAKKTHELIPLCHPLMIEGCSLEAERVGKNELKLWCTVRTSGKTGVEMEALTGVSVAALTVYDMCKALSHDMVIKETRLERKTGGKSDFSREQREL
uniref:cyclic pyranopterin monophosphate synthase n=1 Tax=Guillardia theta (strain CCMP2712) TaxID=905079 RepID=A0A0C3SM06_GUITC